MRNACDELFETIKNIDSSLGDLRLTNATYDKVLNLIKVNVVSDIAIDIDGVAFIEKSIKEKFKGGVEVKVYPHKSICDKEIAKNAILKYIGDNCFSVAHTIQSQNVVVFSASKKVNFEISLSQDIAEYFKRTNLLDEMCESLERQYSNDFIGVIRLDNSKTETQEEYSIESVSHSELESNNFRCIKVLDVEKFLDDTVYDLATYIADGIEYIGTVYFAGTVLSVEEKQTQKGKPYFVITINDKSGTVSGKLFTNDKNKLKKMEKIGEGSVIILRGENEIFQGRASLMIKGFNLCSFPKDFTIKEKPSKKAPQNYSLVFPKPVEIAKQDDIFTIQNSYDEDILNTEYTVVDIETTGTDIINDKITEIGAVKIVNGKITEQFQVLINPEMHISDKIVELTGIDDELVKNCPTIDKVFPDFFKFLGDSVFIAHNVDFDYRFLKNSGKELGYVIKNDTVDTLALARKKLPNLRHHKLNYVCDYYNITFRHHRALSDALATAEAFLEMVKR